MSISKRQLEKLRAEIKIEIGEVEDHIPRSITKLKEVISAEDDGIIPHPPNYDDIYLKCIRAAKYDIKRAAKLYKNFCKLRQKSLPGILKISIPNLHEKLYRSKALSILAKRDHLGRKIVLLNIANWDSKAFSIDSMFANLFLLLDEALTSEDTQLQGFVIVADCKGFSWAQARLVGLVHLQTFFKMMQDSYPARFKEIHFINNPPLVNALLATSKPFLKEKIRNRIFCHGTDLESFHKLIDPSILPKSMGGKLAEDNYEDKQLLDSLMQKDDYYKDFLKSGYP